MIAWLPYLVGWSAGWLMLWRLRPLPVHPAVPAVSTEPDTSIVPATSPGDARSPQRVSRSAIAVIVPARNESSTLPTVLAALVAQLRPGDELVVVDDHSTDRTAAVAASLGARVLSATDFDKQWMGKPHACWQGANSTTAPMLVFIDADVDPSHDLLDRLAATINDGEVVSVQPLHRTESLYEQGSMLFNIVAMMGCANFTVMGRRAASVMAFGPVLAVTRTTYNKIGGHAHPGVRHVGLEDIALARAVGASRVFSGNPDTAFRMHPGGWREMVRGWTRSFTGGLSATPWWATIAIAAWVWSVAGGWLAWPWAYPLTAVQLLILGRRAGRFNPLTALLFPVTTLFFVAVVGRGLVLRATGRSVRWKDRPMSNRS